MYFSPVPLLIIQSDVHSLIEVNGLLIKSISLLSVLIWSKHQCNTTNCDITLQSIAQHCHQVKGYA